MTCVGLGQHERAIDLYRGCCRVPPQPAELHLSIAHSLKTLGRRDEAIAEYRAAASAPPGLRRCLLEPGEPQDLPLPGRTSLSSMRAAEARDRRRRSIDRYHLCFALGKALEDRGDVPGVLRRITSAAMRSSAPRAATGPKVHGAQYPPAERGVHPGAVRAPARGGGAPRAGPDLHRRPAALRLHPDRADPGLALARSRARRSWPTSRASWWSCRAATGIWTIRAIRACSPSMSADGLLPPRREVPHRHARLPQRQGALHRQDAEQLPPHRASST